MAATTEGGGWAVCGVNETMKDVLKQQSQLMHNADGHGQLQFHARTREGNEHGAYDQHHMKCSEEVARGQGGQIYLP